MSEPTVEIAPTEPVEPTEPTLSNSEIKNHPGFRQMAERVKELESIESDRQAADEAAKIEAETKRLEADGNYKAALELKEKALKDMETTHAKELQSRDIRTGLIKAGFTNDVFISGAVLGFDGSSDISAYVASIAGDESNASLLGTPKTPPPAPPGEGNIGSPQKGLTPETAKQYAYSDDPIKQLEAANYSKAYREANGGKMPWQ